VNQGINDPRFLELIGLGSNQIEIEDGRFGSLFIDFQGSSLKGSRSFESACGPKTFETIDEYQRSFKLTVDDRRELIVLGQRSSHEQIGFGLYKPVAIEPEIEVG
jgi:hypothetical protein